MRKINILKNLRRRSITQISKERVLEMHKCKPKRFSFGSDSQVNALKKVVDKEYFGIFRLKFTESIKDMFEFETGLNFKNGPYGFWCPLTEEEYVKADEFRAKYRNIVFLRDTLDISIAYSENFTNNFDRSEIGELEYNAKYKECEKSLRKLVLLLGPFIKESSLLINEIDYICAIPSSDNSDDSLPRKLVVGIVKELDNKDDISHYVRWKQRKKSLKNTFFDDKWQMLETTGVEINLDLRGKNVLLVDDLYQSGITMQFVAMKLKERGCKRVYGLAVVKSKKDTDNK